MLIVCMSVCYHSSGRFWRDTSSFSKAVALLLRSTMHTNNRQLLLSRKLSSVEYFDPETARDSGCLGGGLDEWAWFALSFRQFMRYVRVYKIRAGFTVIKHRGKT